MTTSDHSASLVLPSPPVGVRYGRTKLHQRSYEAGFVDGVDAVFSETLGYDDRPAGDALADLQRRLAIAERAESDDLPREIHSAWDHVEWIRHGSF